MNNLFFWRLVNLFFNFSRLCFIKIHTFFAYLRFFLDFLFVYLNNIIAFFTFNSIGWALNWNVDILRLLFITFYSFYINFIFAQLRRSFIFIYQRFLLLANLAVMIRFFISFIIFRSLRRLLDNFYLLTYLQLFWWCSI